MTRPAGTPSRPGAAFWTSAEELQRAVHAAGLGTWSWDRTTGEVTWGGRMGELYELDLDTFDGSLGEWLRRIVDDDRDAARSAIDPASDADETFRTEHRVLLGDGTVRWVECVGAVLRDDRGAVVGSSGCARDISEQMVTVGMLDRSAEVDAALAELGRRLIEAAEEDDVIDLVLGTADILRAAELSVAMVIDPTTIELRRRDGSSDRRSVAEPVLPGVRVDEVVASGVRAFATTAEPSPRSVLLSPLLDDERCTVAVLIFEWDRIRTFDANDRDEIETLTRLCGQALRRAQLGRESVQLAAIARSFAIARTAVELADQLIVHAETFLGATTVALRFFDQAEANLVSVADSLPPGELADRYGALSMDVVAPPTEAVRSDRSIWIEDLRPQLDRYASVADVVDEADVHAVASIPLHNSDGSVVGVVSFGWSSPMRFGRRRRAHLETLTDLAAQALERVRLHESEHAVVLALQRQLLTEPVDHGDVEIVTHYEPASATVGMGGDWYQDFELPDGSVVAIVGDVVGHGVNAIASMSRLQHLLVALVRVGTPLEELLSTLDAIIAPGDALATAMLLHVDPAQDRLGVLAAGHPPPLLVLPGESPTVLEGARRPLLGVRADRTGSSPGPDSLRYVDFPPGAVVLAYTDGLIERRRETIDTGIGRLVDAVAAEPLGAADLRSALDRVVERVRSTPAEPLGTVDDVAALLIRRHARA